MSTQKTLKKIELKKNEKEALKELKEKILGRFPDTRIVLYGSKARGDSLLFYVLCS